MIIVTSNDTFNSFNVEVENKGGEFTNLNCSELRKVFSFMGNNIGVIFPITFKKSVKIKTSHTRESKIYLDLLQVKRDS